MLWLPDLLLFDVVFAAGSAHGHSWPFFLFGFSSHMCCLLCRIFFFSVCSITVGTSCAHRVLATLFHMSATYLTPGMNQGVITKRLYQVNCWALSQTIYLRLSFAAKNWTAFLLWSYVPLAFWAYQWAFSMNLFKNFSMKCGRVCCCPLSDLNCGNFIFISHSLQSSIDWLVHKGVFVAGTKSPSTTTSSFSKEDFSTKKATCSFAIKPMLPQL